jgi:hypothetical protein
MKYDLLFCHGCGRWLNIIEFIICGILTDHCHDCDDLEGVQ